MGWLSDQVNLLALIGAAAILILTIGVSAKYIRQMKTEKATGELKEEAWDGIGEYKNPLPIGWALSYIGTMIWAIWYWFVGYPLNAYSQIGEYNEEVAAHTQKFESTWANPDHDTLMAMGEGVFLVQCAPCHGIDGSGMEGKAASFMTWGTEEGITQTILKGSKGLNYQMGEMPAGLLDEAGAKKVAAYVIELSGKRKAKNPELVAEGQALYASTCASCHGEDAKGMGGMAPDLTTYGTPVFVADALERGKKGHIGTMPSFKGRLSHVQNEAVGTYILSLGQ